MSNLKWADVAEALGTSEWSDYTEKHKKNHKIVLFDRKQKLHEVNDIIKIFKDSVKNILHNSLCMRKLFLNRALCVLPTC